ncbi:capsular polysaccharide biosynthesis protein CapF [Nonlabens tegetincola]
MALREDVEVLTFTRDTPESELDGMVSAADFVFHLAGVNRPPVEKDFIDGNVGLTERLAASLEASKRPTPLLVTSSTQAALDNPYGRSKRQAEEIALSSGRERGAPVFVYRLPGVFGKWSKPNYNSVVATFCHNLVLGLPLEVHEPEHQLNLAYVDDVIGDFIQVLDSDLFVATQGFREVSRTFTVSLGDLRDRLESLHAMRDSLQVPALGDDLNRFLYATYTSYFEEDGFGYSLGKSVDDRGWLAEFVKSDAFGQIFVSKTRPGVTRGNHWHKTKIEKFLVVSGDAEITFRNKLNDSDVIRYVVNGDEARVLDIPAGYVHAITNTGSNDLVTIFWASEIFDPKSPDTFFEAVE